MYQVWTASFPSRSRTSGKVSLNRCFEDAVVRRFSRLFRVERTTRAELVICLVILVITGYISMRSLYRPRLIRKDPLISPVQFESLSSRGIQLADGQEWKLAGISLTEDEELLEAARRFAAVLAAQGVEPARRAFPDDALLVRCEPRIRFSCGTCRPAKNYFRGLSLNELLVAAGFARYDPDAPGLTQKERDRLQTCETFAKEWDSGIRYHEEAGLSVTDVGRLHRLLEPPAEKA